MVIYRFDGSFDGLLTAVFDSFAQIGRASCRERVLRLV